jgi:hypothetical protein
MDPGKIAKQCREKSNFFCKKYLKEADALTIVLKSHLFIEKCLDEIFSLCLPCPEYILEKKFYDKVKIYEALNLYPSNSIIEQLLTINKIRNKYAHNMEYKINTKDLQLLVKSLPCKSMNNKRKLIHGIGNIIGFMHGTIAILKVLPFTVFCATHKEIFKREKRYNIKKILKKIYPNDEHLKTLECLNV